MQTSSQKPPRKLPQVIQQFIRRLRMRTAAFIAGGTVHQYEGRRRSGEWVKGDIILTPEGVRAMEASFWTGAQVYTDTALTDWPNL